MATIYEEMDEFVNWDRADPPADAIADGMGDGLVANSAAVTQSQVLDLDPALALSPPGNTEALLFENPDADDFSFWAMEHYVQSSLTDQADVSIPPGATSGPDTDVVDAADAASATAVTSDLVLEAAPEPAGPSPPLVWKDDEMAPPDFWIPPEPCTHCRQGGYQCKKLQEGKYKGYCTSCVALRCECSFGLASGGPVPTEFSFPANPWPILGDHPYAIPHDQAPLFALDKPSTPDLPSRANSRGSPKPSSAAMAKLGARFSRESVRILKNWVSTHSRHPYPTEEEKESLQRLTGLNKTQISNWLANARRRGKIPTTRSTSPHVRSSWSGPVTAPVGAIDIPQPRRSGTPSPFERHPQKTENIPLQRWANSPPEHEPASVTDIARAITSSSSAVSSGLNSPYSYNFTDDGSGRSLFNGSSASSAGTSQSSGTGSFASAYSHASRGSFGSSFSSLGRGRRRRRRRSAQHAVGGSDGWDQGHSGSSSSHKRTDGRGRSGPTPLTEPLKTYQCTFCTETFKTKHDWQRHEKSLHLSLERWVCAPQGAAVVNPETKQTQCVFCGEPAPDETHIESHNFATCQERAATDRTFYRKDHLRQHLKLVHGVKFVSWPMDQWKVATPQIRSRCGFCGIVMDTWSFRIDHLADHFKTGRTMAEWKGGWGFEDRVMEMVENSIPPYLIHDERNSPLPFGATTTSPGTPRNAFELIRDELAYWFQNKCDEGSEPSDGEMLVEACRIVFATEAPSDQSSDPPSWLYDLLLSDENATMRARLGPLRSSAEGHMATLRINGKGNVFDDCPLERALHDYVHQRTLLGLTPTDNELKTEACRIMIQLESEIQEPSAAQIDRLTLQKKVVSFFLRLIRGSTSWLAVFRKREHLPRSEVMADESHRPLDDPNSIDASIHNYPRLETELAAFVQSRREAGEPLPDDAALQRQARLIIYELDDGWNQTAADSPKWLAAFKKHHMTHGDFRGPCNPAGSDKSRSPGYLMPSVFFLNDTNCYRRLARELTRFVSAAMSPNNPNCHVPTDEELQHQARWILYDDDDPWNQTAADNAEWLIRFKRDVGILPAGDGPGLSLESPAWHVSQGGTGFAPPYCFPKMPIGPVTSLDCEDAGRGGNVSEYGVNPEAANKFLQSFTTRYAKPATVFCSRELENGLSDFVRGAVRDRSEPFPDDEALRAKAREILSISPGNETPADDPELLRKFKEMARSQLGAEELPMPSETSMNDSMNLGLTNMDLEFSLASMTQADIDNMLQDMNFDYEGGAQI